MKPFAILAGALLPLATAAQAPLPEMQLLWQSLDGNAQDIVGPSSVPFPANTERVWGAQGRKRMQIRVSDRQRQLFEEDLGYEYETLMGTVVVDYDPLDPQKDRLFTLTARVVEKVEGGSGQVVHSARIRVEDIQPPTSPQLLQTFVFTDTDNPIGMCTSPDQNKLIVVFPGALRIYDYDNPDRTISGQISSVSVPPGKTSCDTTFEGLGRARVAKILIPSTSSEEWVALVAASLNSAGCGPPKPKPVGLLVLNLADPSQPYFYGTEPGGNLAAQSWDPCRTSGPCEDYRMTDFDHVRVASGTQDLVYAVGGTQIGLTELDVTGVSDPTIGIVKNATWPIPGGGSAFSVVVDPEAPATNDYLYVIARQNVFVVNRNNPATFEQAAATFGNGPAGGAHFMLAEPDPLIGGPDRRETWTLAKQNASRIFRVTDYTQDSGLPGLETPDVSEGYYSASPTDGGVANFNWSSVYLPTFSGVVRWDISGTKPIPNPNPGSYQPAIAPGQEFTIEHLDIANLGTGTTTDWQLIAPTAVGNFYAWPIDSTSHDPLAGQVIEPPDTPTPYWPSWTGGRYGNDIVWTTDFTGDKWVYFDYSNTAGTQFGIGRYNWTADSWDPAIIWEDLEPVGTIHPNARDLSIEGDRWLLVAANNGFFVVDVQNGLVPDYVHTSDVGGLSFGKVMGIERSGNRLFVSLDDGTNRFAFAMYGFDDSTGQIVDSFGVTTEFPIQVLFDGQPSKPDDFPGAFLLGGERISLIQTQASPKKLRLYSGSGNGHLVEIEWSASTGMTPLSRWHNGGYFDHIADCNVYKTGIPSGFSGSSFGPTPAFTLRVLVSKTRETFEIVSPPDMP